MAEESKCPACGEEHFARPVEEALAKILAQCAIIEVGIEATESRTEQEFALASLSNLRETAMQLAEWKAGALNAATIAYPIGEGPHTIEAWRAATDAYMNGSEEMRLGADAISEAVLARDTARKKHIEELEEVLKRVQGELRDATANAHHWRMRYAEVTGEGLQ